MIVTVDIERRDDGCEVTLTDEAAPAEWAERNREGWSAILDGLGDVIDAV